MAAVVVAAGTVEAGVGAAATAAEAADATDIRNRISSKLLRKIPFNIFLFHFSD